MMDPMALSRTSSTLNLRLLRWRALPELDLNLLASTKCLILGAGTLGSNVARLLLAWGIRDITFLDNSTVSWSNPVRQSLSEFAHARDKSTKVDAAIDILKRVVPDVNVKGHQLTIPMPGHPPSNDQEQANIISTIHTLTDLIKSSDLIFMLTDSRESRWLPTLLARKFKKKLINAAIGMDSWMVMRHGAGHVESVADTNTDRADVNHALGCYFCSDVVAPRDVRGFYCSLMYDYLPIPDIQTFPFLY